jgi:hypothetical protein
MIFSPLRAISRIGWWVRSVPKYTHAVDLGRHGKTDPLVGAPLGDPLVLEHVVAMVDALAPQEVQARLDVAGRRVLAGERGTRHLAPTVIPGLHDSHTPDPRRP